MGESQTREGGFIGREESVSISMEGGPPRSKAEEGSGGDEASCRLGVEGTPGWKFSLPAGVQGAGLALSPSYPLPPTHTPGSVRLSEV